MSPWSLAKPRRVQRVEDSPDVVVDPRDHRAVLVAQVVPEALG
jgi:hypothetical protein